MGYCKTCRYWKKAENETGHSLGLGTCKTTPMLWRSTEWSKDGDARIFSSHAVDKTAFVQDGSDYVAALYTKPEHSCTMYKSA